MNALSAASGLRCVQEDDVVDPVLDARAISDGFAALRLPRQRSLGLFTGDLHRGPTHVAYMRKCKESRKIAAERDRARDAKRALEGTWNLQRLREGDKVGDCDDTMHPNHWSNMC